ncbi:two-component system sensor histidine kinase NtrB [Desulfospira joergensenii]|uniref:two-component system sensor histidine kinase NtrB n=1 Tax=Desulfospira joergensenii TaxID=53329 RepID=UPI0003B3A840|nr:ATP-binding protein [Desulfospira joergensenii]
MNPKIKKILFIGLLVMVGIIGVLHYTTPGHLILFHDSFRRLSYFPIAIGAILYGVRGGLALAVLSCLSFVPHLFLFWSQGPEAYYSELSEIIFYLLAGLVIGLISSRENRLQKEYRRISEKLAKSYKRLHEQAVRLVQAEKELGQAKKLSVLGRLSASLAHEIKNPLASIQGAAEILADEVGADHPKHEFIEIMRSEILRLNNSVDEVLAYCRGQQADNRDPYEALEIVIEKVCQMAGQAIREKSIRLAVDKNQETARFPVAEPAMTQVLMNLLLNAADAVEKKGKIQICHYRDETGRICIEVSDNGPGISPDMAEEVFNSFVTFKEGGTGLGLSISKRIVERLGGTIRVTPSETGGACFRVCLPRKETLNR